LKSEVGSERLLIVNAGDNLSKKGEIGIRQANLIMASYSLMGVDLVALGTKDFFIGADELKKIAAVSRIPFVCANLHDSRGGVPYFIPYLKINRGKQRILITSVIDPTLEQKLGDKKLSLSDPVKAIENVRQSISHDIFIVVCNARVNRAEKWVSQLKNVDLVVLGKYIWFMGNRKKVVGSTAVVSNNNRGKAIAYVDFIRLSDGSFRITDPVFMSLSEKKIPPDPVVAGMVDEYEKWLREYNIKNRRKRLQKLGKTKFPEAAGFYVGKDWCVRCHQKIVRSWEKTAHARAMDSLKNREKEFDPDCLRCHVTGMGDKRAGGGFTDTVITAHMAGVQCEACHGPAGPHLQAPEQVHLQRIPGREVCLKCHTPDRDADFNYDADLKKTAH